MKYFFTVVAAIFATSLLYAQKSDKFVLKTVVIDAGHGGHDAGATYGNILEKNIALDVALNFGNKIKQEFPDVKVVYTRDKDVYIPLDERGNIANKAKGDFFISIHVNSAETSAASGTETFTLGLHKSAESLAVAKKENSVITMEEGYEKKYQGFDPKDPESYIMFGLGQYGFSVSSITFADLVEQNYRSNDNGFKSRGIKQSGFLVLWRSSMPSVLTEIGFLSNSNDRKLMVTESGRDRIATSLFTAFKQYKQRVEVESNYSARNDSEIKKGSGSNDKLDGYDEKAVGYALQLMTSATKIKRTKTNFGKYFEDVIEIKDGKKYKYCIGIMNSYDDILSLQKTLRKDRYKDCFIIGVDNGKIVSHTEIRKIKK